MVITLAAATRLKVGVGICLGLGLLAVSGWLALRGATPLAMLNRLDPAAICTVEAMPTSGPGFLALLSVGLLTGLSHCVGMCGPLVGAFVARRRANRQEVSPPLVLFQMGRLTTYLSLGAVLGSGGYLLSSTIRTWQGGLAIGFGLVVMLMGLSLLGWLPLQHGLAGLGLARWVGRWLGRMLASPHPAAPFGLGLANGLLPCGPVYTMALLAGASGSPIRGAGLMLIFGLGTLPAMLGVGFSASLLTVSLRTQLYRFAALLTVAVGCQLTLRGMALSGHIGHASLGSLMLW